MRKFSPLSIGVALLVPALAVGAISGIESFSPGDPITAAGINGNFDLLEQAVEVVNERVDAAEKSIAALQVGLITSNETLVVADCAELSNSLTALTARRVDGDVSLG